MASPSGQSSAERLVRSISKDHGYLGESVYARMDPELRREVQEAMLAKDKMIGASVILLARELYSKDVRFIFELLQNADDNHYQRALRARQEPRVAFHLYKDKVVIECNEDGFNEANLRAICSIGKSSKVGGHGYIGEKGIGFKSVFKVAWKVHIQSGDYSFTFTHRPNDPGMGMISPEWVDGSGVSGKPDAGWTRITLHLHQDSEAATRQAGILQQLNDLDNTMLLFLKNLRHVDVHVCDGDEGVSSTALSIKFNETTHRAVLKKYKTNQMSSPETVETYCHVTKHIATNLARSANRTYTEAEEASRSYGKAEVILAFPLSSDDVPIVEAQQVYAFLPIRGLGFKFLIQTDFVTVANREDVVTSAPRNIALLDGIADAFITAVHQMYSHKTLRYLWMRYLSEMKTYPWDDFWKRLVDKITAKIKQAEIMEPRRGGSPRLITDLRIFPSTALDIHGNPLFEDLPGLSEVYISSCYLFEDRLILREYGLQVLYQGEIIKRVEYDLSLANSKIKDPTTVAAWHTRAALALSYSWEQSWTSSIIQTRELRILPLTDGRWVAAKATQVYFSTLDSGIAVPNDIGLPILAASACANSKRAELFKHLGARHADVNDIRKRILAKYARGDTMNLETSYANLVFLYQTCTHLSDAFKQYDSITLYDSSSKSYPPSKTDFYFPSDDPFSPWQLSRQYRGESTYDPLQKFLSYVNSRYLDNAPQDSGRLSWREWLAGLGVRRRPRLVERGRTSLSNLCTYVAQNMSESFLGFLQYAWESEKESVLASEDTINKLKGTPVICNDKDAEAEYELGETYLPLPSLLEKTSELMEGDEFPFLWLGGASLSEGDLGPWIFLEQNLNVGSQDDAQFYADLLYYTQTYTHGENIKRHERMIDIYGRIYSRIVELRDRASFEKKLRDRVQEYKLVYIPGCGDDGVAWVSPSDCLLGAPRALRHKWPVAERYKTAFPKRDLALVTRFFQNTLGIASYTWEDTIREIRHLKDKENSDFVLITSIYESLNKARSQWVATGINVKTTREIFETYSLIFVQNEVNQYRWVKPSECLWSSATEIQDRTSLNSYYDDKLEDFFVDILGVPRLDVNMVYDELLRVHPSQTTVEHAKALIWQMNALLTEGEEPNGTSEKLLMIPILPVRYANGDVKLCSGENEFAIVDRRPLEELFRGKVKFLDFDLGQVHKLEPFLGWARLRQRFLSNVAKEISVVEEDSAFPVSDPSRDIARKAEALTRVAVHLRSSRARDVQGFYDLLRNAKTLETGSISSELTIYQDGAKISVEQAQSEVLIQENNTGLKIYVPNNEESLEVCFGSSLPKQLVTWMATNPVTQILDHTVDQFAIAVVTGVLAIRSATAINRILEKDGIIDVNIPDLGPELEAGHGHADAAREVSVLRGDASIEIPSTLASDSDRITPPSSASPFSAFGTASPSAINTPGSSWGGSSDYYASGSGVAYRSRYGSSTTYARVAYQPVASEAPETRSSASEYRRLLAHVAIAARATVNLPTLNTASSVADPSLLLPVSGPMFAPVGGWAATDHEKTLVGAAGELFAFELLRVALQNARSDLNLSRDVWQTPIRAHVAAGHADYEGMEAWLREEPADIIINGGDGDKDGRAAAVLVGLLVNSGYLGAEWGGRAVLPKCYIEVKATLGPWGTPFFMSDSQYRKMKELTTPESIYMIFRVFHMGNNSIGLRIYMDPARMEREGKLKFSADRWTVTRGPTLEV